MYASGEATTPIAAPWARCTSDADGDCSFVVPDTDDDGASEGARYFVGQPENGISAGWYTNTSLRTGAGSGSGSVQSPYRFLTPALEEGQTYSSTSDFMLSTDYAATPYVASGAFLSKTKKAFFPSTTGKTRAVVPLPPVFA
ncbi:hypothetical protein ACFWB3_22485, partial [[Kitasatospora] papulosa]